ncbi:MAG: hypothetical protein KTR31_10790 [Myxococcales bacterium]|nr:hypothetical protein [Myxococcales bacterium]
MNTLLASTLTWSAGYFGGFVTHPGAFVAVERPLLAKDLLVVGARAGGTHHFRNHTALFAQGELGTRWGATKGPFVEGFAGVGLEQRWLAGSVYVESDTGVRRTVDFGRPGLRLSGALGAGWAADSRVFGRAEGWITWVGFRRSVPGIGLSVGATFGGKS